MGIEEIHAEATRSQDRMNAYVVRALSGPDVDPYRAMIYSKWLYSLRYGNDFFRMMEDKSFYRNYRAHIERILALPNTVVHVASIAGDHDVALGFSVCRPKVLDYVHVHKDQRLQGIARRLIPADTERVTHMTRTGLLLWGTKDHKMKFDPFA